MRTESRTPEAPARGQVPATTPASGHAPALPGAFEAWYEEHRPAVFRYVRFHVPTREAAEDVTSEVFVRALRAFGRYDPGRAAPRTWLLRIARNRVRDHLRGLARWRSRHVRLEDARDLAADLPTQEERILKEERVRRMLDAARSLRGIDREILSLRYGAGLRNVEIAEHLGVDRNAVSTRLHRALARLRVAVEEGEGTGDR